MVDIILDIQEGGARIIQDRGWEIRRVITILNVSAELGGYDVIRQAYEAVVTEIGAIGFASHPSRTNCILRELTPEIIDSTTIKFTALYTDMYGTGGGGGGGEPPSYSTIQCGAGLTQSEAHFDRDGKAIGVLYFQGDAEEPLYPAVCPKLEPEPTITITRIENEAPMNKAIEYVGTINDVNWNLRPSDPRGSWLCTAILGTSNDGGVTYEVTYNFLYKNKEEQAATQPLLGGVEGWDEIIYYKDPKTGHPPKNAIRQVDPYDYLDGITYAQIYPIKNFNNLNLP